MPGKARATWSSRSKKRRPMPLRRTLRIQTWNSTESTSRSCAQNFRKVSPASSSSGRSVISISLRDRIDKYIKSYIIEIISPFIMDSLDEMQKSLEIESHGDGRARRKWLEALYVAGRESPSLATKIACAQLLGENGKMDHSIKMLDDYLAHHEIASNVKTFANDNPSRPSSIQRTSEGPWEERYTPTSH